MSQADYYLNDNNSACDTIHSQLSTLNYSMLPFQGEMVVGDLNPTRWVGLAYIALSGRV
ncbi:MAG: hypothetical protein LBE12_05405 [Planctomycetaceae bacterium]|nr:hypothetical protein [Planctomycetaceae bacterium]